MAREKHIEIAHSTKILKFPDQGLHHHVQEGRMTNRFVDPRGDGVTKTESSSQEVKKVNGTGVKKAIAATLLKNSFHHCTIPACITTFDSGRIVYINPAFAELTGWQHAEVVGRSIYQLGLWKNSVPWTQLQDHARSGELPVKLEGQIKTRTGRILDVLVSSRPFQYRKQTLLVNAIVDITVQKQVAQQQEKYRLFFEDDISGIFIATPEGKILDCNPSFLRILGFKSKEEALQTNMDALFLEPQDYRRLLQRIRREGKLNDAPVKLRHREGAVLHIIVNVRGEFDDQGNLKTLRAYSLDITQRKQMEEQVLQATQLEALGRLVGGITHDFNNMLTIIRGYSDLALAVGKPSTQARQAIMAIQQAVTRAQRLSGKLMSFIRHEENTPQLLHLNQVLDEFLNFFKKILSKHINVKYELHARQDWIICMDPTQLERILLNLMVNARDAMPNGGTITLRTKTFSLTPAQATFHVPFREGNWVCLSVTDTGTGMDEQTRQQIFEPFFTTKGKGTGLGLSTVYGIVTQSGGHIHVESNPGVGTTFHLFFPATNHDGSAGKNGENPSNRWKRIRGTETVLIIEEDPKVAIVLVETLTHFGYHPIHTTTLNGARKLLGENGHSIQVIISEAVLPDGSGEAAIQTVLEPYAHIPLLVMAGCPEAMACVDTMASEQSPYLQKPFSPLKLVEILRTMLDGEE